MLTAGHCTPVKPHLYTQTRSQRSPRESLLSCRCNIGYARSGWSSPSRCGLRSRCCGSSRWERHQRSMSDSCWWAPADETEDNRYSHPFLSVYRLCNAKGRQRSSSVEGRFQRSRPDITFLTVTLLVDKRCVFAKERPAFSTLILTPAWSSKEWSYSSFYTTPRLWEPRECHAGAAMVDQFNFRIYGKPDVPKLLLVASIEKLTPMQKLHVVEKCK